MQQAAPLHLRHSRASVAKRSATRESMSERRVRPSAAHDQRLFCTSTGRPQGAGTDPMVSATPLTRLLRHRMMNALFRQRLVDLGPALGALSRTVCRRRGSPRGTQPQISGGIPSATARPPRRAPAAARAPARPAPCRSSRRNGSWHWWR